MDLAPKDDGRFAAGRNALAPGKLPDYGPPFSIPTVVGSTEVALPSPVIIATGAKEFVVFVYVRNDGVRTCHGIPECKSTSSPTIQQAARLKIQLGHFRKRARAE